MITNIHVGSALTYEYIVDTVAELDTITTPPKHSRALVITGSAKTGELYILNGSEDWVKMGDDVGGGV